MRTYTCPPPAFRLAEPGEGRDDLAENKKRKTYLVIGLGRFGSAMCERLAEAGAHVIGIDKVRARVEEMSEKLEYVAQLDAMDETALLKVGAKDVDVAIVSLGEKSEGAIFITAILRELGIPKIIVRANDELEMRILHKVGAHKVISPESEMGQRTADLLENPWMMRFVEAGDGHLITGNIPPQPDMVGKALKNLDLPRRYGCIVTLVERGSQRIFPQADLVIEQGDKIWIFGEKDRLAPLLSTIKIAEDTPVEESE